MVNFSVFEDDFEPEVENQSSDFGGFELVGHGKKTSEYCGKYSHSKGCLRVENHNKKIFDKDGNLVDCSRKGYVKIFHSWCCKPSCPVCFRHGWAIREAGNIERRLSENGKYRKGFGRWGSIEHIVASVPPKDYYLSYEAMRSRAVKILADRGVIGGSLIFHGGRYDLRRHWFWSPHFHVLGFIRGGYARCRGCQRKWNCLKGCGGFDDRNYYSGFLKDGWVMKVFGKRENIFGTAFYELNHATVKKDSKRFQVVTWFGVCSYRKLKITVEMKKHLCPICGEELYKVWVHVPFVRDRDAFNFVSEFFVDVVGSDGIPDCSDGG